MKIKHYVITLFNLRLKWQGRSNYLKSIDTATDDEYLKNAFNQFEEYTLQSFRNQSCKDFEWIILFSADTPDKYKERIKKNADLFTPLYLTDDDTRNYRKCIVEYIKSKSSSEETYYITTRCDNDDVVANDFITLIQKYVKTSESDLDYVISFPMGYELEKKSGYLYSHYQVNNHFTTLVSRRNESSIMDYGHISATSKLPTVVLEKDDPKWLVFCHDNNVYNRFGDLNPSAYKINYDLGMRFGVKISNKGNILLFPFMYINFLLTKLWDKKTRIPIVIKRKLGIKYKDDRTDR